MSGTDRKPDESSVYLPEDIQRILQISRSATYVFLGDVYKSQKLFHLVKVGKLYRVDKASFDLWLKGK